VRGLPHLCQGLPGRGAERRTEEAALDRHEQVYRLRHLHGRARCRPSTAPSTREVFRLAAEKKKRRGIRARVFLFPWPLRSRDFFEGTPAADGFRCGDHLWFLLQKRESSTRRPRQIVRSRSLRSEEEASPPYSAGAGVIETVQKESIRSTGGPQPRHGSYRAVRTSSSSCSWQSSAGGSKIS